MGLLRRRLRPSHRPRGTRDRGAAMVEFVFVLPILLMLVFAIIAFGLALNTKQDLTRAAAEGARAGAVALPTSTQDQEDAAQAALEAAVAGFYRDGCNNPAFTLNGVQGGGCAANVDPMSGTVTVTLTFDTSHLPLKSVPFTGTVLPDQLVSQSVALINTP